MKSVVSWLFDTHQGRLVDQFWRRYPRLAAFPDLRDALTQRLSAAPVVLDGLYGALTGDSILYFEADKRRRPRQPSRMGSEFGLVRPGRDRKLAADSPRRKPHQRESVPADRPERVPLGLFRVNGSSYWLMELHGYESLAYAVYEVTPAAVRQVTLAGAGGC